MSIKIIQEKMKRDYLTKEFLKNQIDEYKIKSFNSIKKVKLMVLTKI